MNSANRNETGKFWHMETCSDGHPHVHDKDQMTLDGNDRDALVGNAFNASRRRARCRSIPRTRTATRRA